MPSATPYIFVSPRMMGQIDRVTNPLQRGITSETVEGHHAIWAAQIPYIPAFSLTDQEAQTLFGPDANSRIQWLMNRQIRFLYDLAQITTHQATFELRYLADPRPGTEARVSLVLLGKSFDSEAEVARVVAQAQWERVSALFPSETPFRYPLIPVTHQDDPPGTPPWKATGFAHWFEPVADAELDSAQYGLIEIRKHEDWPTLRFLGNANLDLDYIPHPFVPPVDYTGMARLLETLSRQTHKAFIGITLRPQRVTQREEVQFTRFADWYAQAASGELVNMNPAVRIQEEELGRNDYKAYFRQRAALGKKVYEMLARERQSLVLINIRIVAFSSALPALKEALGSEIIANSGTAYPCQYDVVVPRPGPETHWARHNMQWLEMVRWRVSAQLVYKVPELARFRFFATVPEAIAVFRLPTAPPDAQLRGIEVVDDPFTTVPVDTPAQDDLVGLGEVTVNGVPLPIEYRLPRSALARGLTFLGEDTNMRAEVVSALITHLAALQVPFVALGLRESQSMGLAASKLAGAMVPPPEAQKPERLVPPVGVQPLRWSAAAASALALAFDLPTYACQVLRLALTQTFVAAGVNPAEPWTGTENAPGLLEFIAALTHEMDQQITAGDSRQFIRDRCLPGLQELALLSDTHLCEALPALSAPLLIQLPGTGAQQQDLLRAAFAFASASVALEQAAALSALPAPKAVLLLIDPQYLFPHKRTGDQPFFPLVEALRQAGGSLMLITGQPHLVDHEVLATAILGAERLTQTDALTVSQHVMRLSDREIRRLANLAPGDMLWQRDGRTVLVRQPHLPHLSIEAPQTGGAV